MPKKRGLGRGLEALLGPSARSQSGGAESSLRELPVDLIQRGRYQPRTHMNEEALQELANSIRAQGIVQPVVVRAVSGGRYELIAGERRWRAAQLAELQSVPAIVRDVDDESTLALALIENIQREDLNPLEEAMALSRLIEEFDLTHEAAARAVGRSRAAVSNLLRLLDLGADTRALLEEGSLEMGHARALLALDGGAQAAVAREIVARDLSVRETEALVRRRSAQKKPNPASAGRLDPDLRHLQEELSERLGAPVSIKHSARGAGQLVVRYGSLDELEGVLAKIR